MLKISISKITTLFLLAFFLILSIAAQSFVSGQSVPELTKPFKKCLDLRNSKSDLRLIASDNDSVVIQIDDKNLKSLNIELLTENWKSDLGGKIIGVPFSDQSYIYFLTNISTLDSNQKYDYLINALSIKTGLVKWQKKLAAESEIKLIDAGDWLLYIDQSGTVTTVEKQNGDQVWSKNFEDLVFSAIFLDDQNEVVLVLKSQILRLSIETGAILQKTVGVKDVPEVLLPEQEFLLLGLVNGQVVRFNLKENVVSWRIRTGGKISSLVDWKEFVLASSYDNFLYCLSKKTGKLIWKKRVGGRINIKPLIISEYIVVVGLGENTASILNIYNGKLVNQVQIENENYFVDSPEFLGDNLVFLTLNGISVFSNKPCN